MPNSPSNQNSPNGVSLSQGLNSVVQGMALVGDVAVLPILGAYWATSRISFLAPGSGTFEIDYTVDGINWIPSGLGAPLVKRTDLAAANPTVSQANATTPLAPAAGSTWELALGGNVLAVRVKMLVATGAGPATITIAPGLPVFSGTPVRAVLYDTVSGSGAALDTGTLDTSGWDSAFLLFTSSGGVPSFTASAVGDTGTNFLLGTALAANGSAVLGDGASNGPSGGPVYWGQVPKRLRVQSAAIAVQTSEARIEVSRGA